MLSDQHTVRMSAVLHVTFSDYRAGGRSRMNHCPPNCAVWHMVRITASQQAEACIRADRRKSLTCTHHECCGGHPLLHHACRFQVLLTAVTVAKHTQQ